MTLESKLQALVAEWRTQETRPSPSILGDIQFSIYEARKACANELEALLAERQEPLESTVLPVLPVDAETRAKMHGMNCRASVMGHDEECTCGLQWRIALQTEREMHNAWRKRAEEAELRLAAKPSSGTGEKKCTPDQ